jgi:tetratricopeptide (TPR) repeat protein
MKPIAPFSNNWLCPMACKWFLLRLFFAGLGLACAPAWADTASDIETLIQNKQWMPAQRMIQAELDRKSPSAQSPQWRLMSSQVLAGLGKADEAIGTLQSLIQEFPELPEPYNNLGVLLAAQGQYGAAVEALIGAVQARPNYKVALKNLGDLYTAMAQQAYDKANALNDAKSLLPLPKPSVQINTTTNTRTLR